MSASDCSISNTEEKQSKKNILNSCAEVERELVGLVKSESFQVMIITFNNNYISIPQGLFSGNFDSTVTE